MIEVKNLTKYFGPILAVTASTLTWPRRNRRLLGLNGAGKTTTMRVLTTYLPATSATAEWPARRGNHCSRCGKRSATCPRTCR